jgi:hypothetical protein
MLNLVVHFIVTILQLNLLMQQAWILGTIGGLNPYVQLNSHIAEVLKTSSYDYDYSHV